MDLPHWRIANRDSFDEYISAAIRLNEIRTKVSPVAKHALVHGSAIGAKTHQPLPSWSLHDSPVPPVRLVGLAIENSAAADRDVLFFEGINEWRVIHQFGAFPTREYDRKIFAGIVHKLQHRALRQMQIDAALQTYRAGQELSARNDNPAATGSTAGGDCFRNGFAAFIHS